MKLTNLFKTNKLKSKIEKYSKGIEDLEDKEQKILAKYRRKTKRVGKILQIAEKTKRQKWVEGHKEILFRLQKGKCNICGKSRKIERLEVDHIIPFSLGGKNNLGNTQLLCISCNKIKRNKVTPEEYNDYIKYERILDL